MWFQRRAEDSGAVLTEGVCATKGPTPSSGKGLCSSRSETPADDSEFRVEPHCTHCTS